MKNEIKIQINAITEAFQNDQDLRESFLSSLINKGHDDFSECNIYDHGIEATLSAVIRANLYEGGECNDKDIDSLTDSDLKSYAIALGKALDLI